MERVNKILKHEQFLFHLRQNEMAEADRCFCRHNMEHFLDVARIGVILNEKEQYGVDDEYIYAVALLHDLGKHEQYERNIPHEVASAGIASVILKDCGYTIEEEEKIVQAISGHRDKLTRDAHNLDGLLYRADKLSRACFACKAKEECNWSEEKKNLSLKY